MGRFDGAVQPRKDGDFAMSVRALVTVVIGVVAFVVVDNLIASIDRSDMVPLAGNC